MGMPSAPVRPFVRSFLIVVLGIIALAARSPTFTAPWSEDAGSAAAVSPGQSSGQAATLLPIPEQEKILYDAFEQALPEVSKRWGPQAAAEVRSLCVGSWCVPGRAKPTSDLDLTIGHKNEEISKFLTRRVNEIADELAGERGGTHRIKVIFNGDPEFAELFSGPTGETFIYQYAKTKSLGENATLQWKVGADGRWAPEWAHVDEYWKGLGREIPRSVIRPDVFAKEAAGMMTKAVRDAENVAEAAGKVAKYMGFLEDFIKPAFQDQWGKLPPQTFVDERAWHQMNALVEVKEAAGLSDAQRAERLMKAFGVETEQELESALKRFVDQGEHYFSKTSRDLAIFDELYRMGSLGQIDDLGRAASRIDRIFEVLGPAAHGLLSAVDVALILHAVYTADDKAAAEQMAITLAAYGMPQAAIAAVVAKLALDLGVTVPADYLVFGPINEVATTGIFDPRNQWHIFTWEQSPFEGMTAETLACRFTTERSEDVAYKLEPYVRRYVENLMAWRGLSGAARFTLDDESGLPSRLLGVMVELWKSSKEKRRQIEQLEFNLYFRSREQRPAEPPFSVWVDRTPIGNRQHRRFVKSAGPGESVTFTLDLVRDFGVITERRIPPRPNAVVDQWCKEGGTTAAFQRWLSTTMPITRRYESGWTPLHVGASISGPIGWRATGGTELALSRDSGASGLHTAEADIDLGSSGGTLGSVQKRYRLSFTPTAQAAGAISVTLGFGLQDDLGSPPQTSTVTLVVNPATSLNPEAVLEKATEKVEQERAQPGAASDACTKDAQRMLDAGREDFERWKATSRGKTFRPFVCGPDPWFPCIPESYGEVWIAVDGALPKDQWGYNRVAGCADAFLKSNTAYNDCVWGVYLEKLEAYTKKRIAACASRIR